MKSSRSFNAALALLVLAGAGLWVNHNLRHEDAPHPDHPAPTAPAATPARAPVPLPAEGHTLAEAPLRPAYRALSGPSLGAVLTAADDAPRLRAGLSRIILDPARAQGERTEALEHLLNLSASDPAATLAPLLVHAGLGHAQCDQILDDSLNGTLAWQADANLAVLSHRKDPALLARAREHLGFLLDADHGDDLAKWTSEIAAAKIRWSATLATL